MEEIPESIFEKLLSEIIFFGTVIAVVIITQRIIDIIFNKYFQKLYRSASPSSRKINKKRYDTLAITFRRLASIVLWIIVIIIILGHFGVNYVALLTGAGAIGVFFGIAGKDIVMDLYVGMMALIEDQYRVGDVIWIDQDHSGTVEDINLRAVKLRDIDGNIHVVPHSMARAIINKTFDFSTVNVEISVGYTTNLDVAKKIINEVGEKLYKDTAWAEKFIEPIKYQTLLQFDKSQVTLRAQGKVKSGDQWAVASEYRQRIKEAFDANGIEVPLSQNVLRTVSEAPTKKSSNTKS